MTRQHKCQEEVCAIPGGPAEALLVKSVEATLAEGFDKRARLKQARQPSMKSLLVAHRGRLLPAPGGLVIFDGITIIGAVGVAGGHTTDQDVLCCQAAFSALETAKP